MAGLINLCVHRETYDTYLNGVFKSRDALKAVVLGLNEVRNDVFHFRAADGHAETSRLRRAARLVPLQARKVEREAGAVADVPDGGRAEETS